MGEPPFLPLNFNAIELRNAEEANKLGVRPVEVENRGANTPIGDLTKEVGCVHSKFKIKVHGKTTSFASFVASY